MFIHHHQDQGRHRQNTDFASSSLITMASSSTAAADPGTQQTTCRLCFYVSDDTVPIFGDAGLTADFAGKIAKYLYLRVRCDDIFPQVICWMCRQHLVTFHQFYAKINDIQRVRLKEGYEELVIPTAEHRDETTTDEPEKGAAAEKPDIKHEVVDRSDADANHEIQENDGRKTRSSKRSKPARAPNTNVPESIIGKDSQPQECSDPAETSAVVVAQKKRRGRPPKIRDEPAAPKTTTVANETALDEDEVEVEPVDCSEGESDDEFPNGTAEDNDQQAVADWDDDNAGDWSTLLAEGKLPNEIIKDGLLLFKGAQLMQIINRFYRLKCELCSHQTKTLRDLFAHYEEQHEQRGHVRCCDAALHRYPAIIMHMARHLQPAAFQCEQCGYVVTRPRFLDAHRLTHLPDAEKPFACAHCDRRFCWKRALVMHERTHSSGDNAADRRRYMCHECGKVFESAGGLCSHRKWTHGGLKQEQGVCHICAKSFATRAGLHEHMELHRPREQTQLQCDVCGKWLMNQRCLKTHRLLHSEVVLECEMCAYTTKKTVLMKRHMVNRHTEAKPFACQLCDKSFKLKRPLTVHMAEAHSTEKRTFQCTFCGRKFNSSTNYYTHRKNRHPAELAALKAKEAAERRKRRIEAGVEDVENEGQWEVLVEWDVQDGAEERSEDDEYMVEMNDGDGDAVLESVDKTDEDADDDEMVELIEMDETEAS